MRQDFIQAAIIDRLTKINSWDLSVHKFGSVKAVRKYNRACVLKYDYTDIQEEPHNNGNKIWFVEEEKTLEMCHDTTVK